MLLGRVRRQAHGRGRSRHDPVRTVRGAASNPTQVGSEGAQVRERLARAGLLDDTAEIRTPATDPVVVAAVRSDAFAHGWGSARLVARHGVRAYDVMPLACAVAARRADSGIDTVACCDRELAEAAVREGFRPLTG